MENDSMLKLLLPLIASLQLCSAFHVAPIAYSILSENSETVVDLTKKSEKRFYLHISNELSPFFLYLTPCGAAVHWQLFSIDREIEVSEELDLISDLSVPLDQSEKFRLVAGEDDKKRMTFFAHRLPKKVVLVVRSASASASVRVFFSPSLFRVEDQYPALPHDVRLAAHVIEEHRKDEVSAQITWKIAGQVRAAVANRYRICTIISRRDPAPTMCDHVEEGVETVKCVPQTNNSVVIDELRRDRTYFVTVFIRDRLRGTSSVYEPQTLQTTALTTRKVARNVPRKQKKSAPRQIVNGQLQHVELHAQKGNFVNLRFVVPNLPESAGNGTQSAMLIVHACDGLVRINLYRNGKVLKRSDAFSGFRRFVVTNIRNGHLRFQIINDDEAAKSVRVWASTDLSTSPYPNLPDDTSVKIVDRTCSSASIQWLRAHDSHVKYCVYRRRENSNFLEQLVSLADNLCEGGLSSSTLVGCYTHSSSTSEDEDAQSLIETTVGGLLPASTYRLDLLATPLDRPNAQALPYRTIWVRTNRVCVDEH
ncbi:unnamed protein product [Caenorhabditis sp. 36 PRJEB53466]|nr:unnamed protein product [Caenorhabditis sp. 36 PRJEB53466]